MFVQDGSGAWWEVRVDAKLPGTMLLRDSQDSVYFITYNNIQQVGTEGGARERSVGQGSAGKRREGKEG